MLTLHTAPHPPFTLAVRQALHGVQDSTIKADFLFLEAWEIAPSSHLGLALRASQIRRANPELAAAINAEVRAARNVTPAKARKSMEPALDRSDTRLPA